jgi:hypothetical protein
MPTDTFKVQCTIHVFMKPGERFARMKGDLEIPSNPFPDRVVVRLGEKRIIVETRPLTYDLKKDVYFLEVPDVEITFDESTTLTGLGDWHFAEVVSSVIQ